jgi:CHAT domain-containing protein/tetratricopeptide (TPR) repeat protein
LTGAGGSISARVAQPVEARLRKANALDLVRHADEVIDLLEWSTRRIDRESARLDWAAAQQRLGAAYIYCTRRSRALCLEHSLERSGDALTVFTRRAYPEAHAATLHNLGIAYLHRVRGGRGDNLNASITAFRSALKIRTRARAPYEWARTTQALGWSYRERAALGDRRDETRAVACFEAALGVLTPSAAKLDHAELQHDLGMAWLHRTGGDHTTNVQRAIEALRSAGAAYDRTASADGWARVHTDLGSAYLELRSGDRDTVDRAISVLREALAVHSSIDDRSPACVATHYHIGRAFAERPGGRRSYNQEQALIAFDAALSLLTGPGQARDRALALNGRGLALTDLQEGDHTESLQAAVGAFRAALRLLGPGAFPAEWGMLQHNLAVAYSELPDDRSQNLERAMAACRAALRVRIRERSADEWAITQNTLGNVLRERIRGNRARNVEQAIAAFRAAQEVRTRRRNPNEWSRTMHNLGYAYLDRLAGDRRDNMERAIRAFRAALVVRTRRELPFEWAMTTHGLGIAFRHRVDGSRDRNIETAISLLNSALELRRRASFPADWAMTQDALADAYVERLRGDPADNLERARNGFVSALRMFSSLGRPFDYASTQVNLGNLFARRLRGHRLRNLEAAIRAYAAALQVFTEDEYPVDWAHIQHNLGNVLAVRVLGPRADNLEQAIACYGRALAVYARHPRPSEERAGLLHDLGNAYGDRIEGERAENVERAIEALTAALELRPYESGPMEWAMTQDALGIAYMQRIHGRREENVERAVAAHRSALFVYTRRATPREWGAAQLNLGSALLDRSGDEPESLKQAIAAFRAALTVHDRRSVPLDWALTQNNLALAHYRLRVGGRSVNLAPAIAGFTDSCAVYARKAMRLEWARGQHNLGLAYMERGEDGDIELAIASLRRALDVFSAAGLAAELRQAGSSLGVASERAHRWPQAARAYEAALEAAEQLYRVSVVRTARLAELHETADLPRQAAYARFRLGDVWRAVQLLEGGRAREISRRLAVDVARLEAASRHDPEAVSALELAADRAAKAEAAQVHSASGHSSSARDFALRAEVARARQAFEAAAKHVEETTGLHVLDRPLPVQEAASAAVPAVPIIYLVTALHGTAAIMVARSPFDQDQTVRIEGVPGSLTLEELSLLLHGHPRGGDVSYATAQLQRPGELPRLLGLILPFLAEHLFGNLGPRLEALGATEVVLIPTGPLALLPLHAVPCRFADGWAPLCERVAVSYAPSLRSLLAARAICGRATGGQTKLAGIADPISGARPLPYARAELDEISGLFACSCPLSGHQATKRGLFSAAKDATHLHLACHGWYSAASPLESRFELARGTLKLREALSARPFEGVRLVVATACQSGVTGSGELADEVLGFPSALLAGGAGGVVASLWNVNDLSTALLAIRFYEYHMVGSTGTADGPMPPAQALRHAQEWLRNLRGSELRTYLGAHRALAAVHERVARSVSGVSLDSWLEEEQPFKDPYHWAGFVYVGG